jgi:hypothetical protein
MQRKGKKEQITGERKREVIAIMWIRYTRIFMMERKFVFLCGCPRSGTTALQQLISESASVACGIERFNRRLMIDDALRKEHFEKERFFASNPHDSWYTDPMTSKFAGFYRGLYERYDQALWVGDKIPQSYRKYSSIQAHFSNPKFLFIYRNVFDVCLSYKQRLFNPQDNWEKSPENALVDWNQSLLDTKKALSAGVDVLGISYEELFLKKSQKVVSQIFSFLEIPVPKNVMASRVMQKKVKMFGDQKDILPLSAEEKLRICMEADTTTFAHIHEQFSVP